MYEDVDLLAKLPCVCLLVGERLIATDLTSAWFNGLSDKMTLVVDDSSLSLRDSSKSLSRESSK